MKKKTLEGVDVTSGLSEKAFAENANNARQGIIVVDLNKKLDDIGYIYYDERLAGTIRDSMYTLYDKPTSVTTNFNLEVDPNSVRSDFKFEDVTPLYLGHNEFNNTTDTEQSFNTATYTKTVTETTSTSMTRGFSINGKGKIFKLPLILKEGTEVTGVFNSSDTKTTTNTETITLTAPAQNVKVPAHKKYKATTYLEQQSYKGPVYYKAVGSNLRTNIHTKGMWIDYKGTPHTKKYQFNEDTGYCWNSLSDSGKSKVQDITINAQSNQMHFEGVSQANGVFGSKLVVNIYDITDGNKLVETRKVAF